MTDIPASPTPQPVSNQPQSAPVATPSPASAPATLSNEAQAMFNQFTLVDPQRQGVGLDKLRVFYPRIGWDVIFAMVNELEAAGRLKKRAVLTPRGTVGYHLYTWQEV